MDLRDHRFRIFVENVTEYAMFLLDEGGYIQTWNAGAQRIKGYAPEEIIGRHFSVFYPAEEVASGKTERELAIARETGMYGEEGWRLRKDGTRFWASVLITALFDPEGKLLGYGKVTRDLTEKKRAEEALRQSEERFRSIVSSVRDYAVFMLDPRGYVLTWNAGAERIKGYAASEIIGKHFSVFIPQEDLDAGKTDMELALATRDGRFEDEGWRVRKDGTRFWANVIITAIRNERDELVGFSKVTRDLTERVQAEQQKINLAAAEAGVKVRDEFLSIASHELKTPLTGLLLQLQTLASRVTEQRHAVQVQRAFKSARRLAALVDSLLDVSRIAAGKLVLDPQPFELGDAVADVVDRMQEESVLAKTPIELARNAPMHGRWDRLRVEQVVLNLVSNALKYAAGQPIVVTVDKHEGKARIQVRDRGPGVPATELQRIFQRFERAVPARNFGGLGLGLYVSREIAQGHGGELTGENMPDGGARFTLTLPL